MSKAVEKALIELVLFTASMFVYHYNIFGKENADAINQKISVLVHALAEEE